MNNLPSKYFYTSKAKKLVNFNYSNKLLPISKLFFFRFEEANDRETRNKATSLGACASSALDSKWTSELADMPTGSPSFATPWRVCLLEGPRGQPNKIDSDRRGRADGHPGITRRSGGGYGGGGRRRRFRKLSSKIQSLRLITFTRRFDTIRNQR